MSDSEYSSEEDEDYIPENVSSENDSGEEEGKKSKDSKDLKKSVVRGRKGGIRLEGEDDGNDSSNDDESEKKRQELEEEETFIKQQKLELAKKAKEEDLWASFKKDTGMAASRSPMATISQKAPDISKRIPSSSTSTTCAVATPSSSTTDKVSITKTYDFAGESVMVTKTVDADSYEAKKARKEEAKKTETKPDVKLSGFGGFKRPGGLNSVLGQINKKPKMSTLEKSKMDWDQFKDQEGLQDDLKNFNKDGYLEKQAFLQRADERKFELEKNVRQGSRR